MRAFLGALRGIKMSQVLCVYGWKSVNSRDINEYKNDIYRLFGTLDASSQFSAIRFGGITGASMESIICALRDFYGLPRLE